MLPRREAARIHDMIGTRAEVVLPRHRVAARMHRGVCAVRLLMASSGAGGLDPVGLRDADGFRPAARLRARDEVVSTALISI